MKLPEIFEKDPEEIKRMIGILAACIMPDDVREFMMACIDAAFCVPIWLKKRGAELSRLRTLLFGPGYKNGRKKTNKPQKSNTENSLQNSPENITTENPPLEGTLEPLTTDLPEADKNKKPGHGRMPHTVYDAVCTDIQLLLQLTVGDNCPELLCKGKLGAFASGVIIRVKGQNFAHVYRYFVEKLRCNLCDFIVKAEIPPEVGTEKYDAAFKAMLALMKYYIAIPFYRQEHFQRLLKFPLSDATQWDLIEKLAGYCYGVFAELKVCAANSQIIHNDDTTLRILDVIKAIKNGVIGKCDFSLMSTLPATGKPDKEKLYIEKNGEHLEYLTMTPDGKVVRDVLAIKIDKTLTLKILNGMKSRILAETSLRGHTTTGERTGMYTTGIMATHEGHPLALFLNGRQHSGENMSDILALRESDKAPVIQMCDALNANISKKFQTIVANCLSHGFRQFEELVEFFEDECIEIMKKLSQVFDHDDETRKMNDQDRLRYHQNHSGPIMADLKKYMAALINQKRVEPNSELGKSIRYMQKNWHKLTRFLSVLGAPLDNNITERALKIAIRNRKSALFYKSEYSANIGGMLTSLIYTCHLNNENPQDYLVALQNYAVQVRKDPKKWLPWNYRHTMAEETLSTREGSAPSDQVIAA